MVKNVVITGVSSGIGRASLDILHAKGYHIFGSVRNQADADKLSKIYPDRFTPLRFDVQNHNEVIKTSKIVFVFDLHMICIVQNQFQLDILFF